MAHIANKVDAKDKKLYEMFVERRYKVDAFQREYRWRRTQVETMISDLSASFMKDYEEGAAIADARKYDCYYMGPIVLCDDGVALSIVDGQQRLTSLTLLIIYLLHLQRKLGLSGTNFRDLTKYLKVQGAGRDSFVMDVPQRKNVIRFLLEKGDTLKYEFKEIEERDESILNLLGRYEDIENLFPEKIKDEHVLPVFIEWMLFRVVVVEITAYSMDNAYTIFETMNDRGLSLNPTEILKAFVLSKMDSDEQSDEMNDFWKERIAQVKFQAGYEADMVFFRSWFRAKFADSKRQKAIGSENEDFEQLGSQFHTWFKNNLKKIGLRKPSDFYYFVKSDMDFFSDVFLKIFKYRSDIYGEKHLFYVMRHYPMADSLSLPLLMAPISKIDSEREVEEKLECVNSFIDAYVNVRTLAHKTITQSSIRDSLYDMMKEIREESLVKLRNIISNRTKKLQGMLNESTHLLSSYSGSYMHYFFARQIYSKQESVDFKDLLRTRKKDSYIICRIFEENMMPAEWQDGMKPYYDSLANYCLIRRNEYKMLPTPLEERISALLPYLDGVKWETNSIPMEFLKTRNDTLVNFIKREWLNANI